MKMLKPKQEILTVPLETADSDLRKQLALGRKIVSMVPFYEVSSMGISSTKLTGYLVCVKISKEERSRVVH